MAKTNACNVAAVWRILKATGVVASALRNKPWSFSLFPDFLFLIHDQGRPVAHFFLSSHLRLIY